MEKSSRVITVVHIDSPDYSEDAMWYPERLEGYEPPTKEKVEIPKIKSKWRHSNSLEYKVILVTNEVDTEAYPLTVVYKCKNGKVWSRPLSEWYRSFTEINKIK